MELFNAGIAKVLNKDLEKNLKFGKMVTCLLFFPSLSAVWKHKLKPEEFLSVERGGGSLAWLTGNCSEKHTCTHTHTHTHTSLFYALSLNDLWTVGGGWRVCDPFPHHSTPHETSITHTHTHIHTHTRTHTRQSLHILFTTKATESLRTIIYFKKLHFHPQIICA